MYQKFNEHGEAGREVRIPPPVILFRNSDILEQSEIQAAKKHFVVVESRALPHAGELVIGRYSVLPFYKELEDDLRHKGAKLINSYREHRYVADLQNYVEDLKELTFRTWNFNDLQDVPDGISLVVKGETNSRKDKWATHMFAKDKQEAVQVYMRLQDDSLIAQQSVYVREYVPLTRLTMGIGGQPVTLEFRFFVAYGEVLCGGFYWSSFADELGFKPPVSQVPVEFLRKAIDRVKDKVNFFVLDVALGEDGKWYVVEVNDGQMSGLSENDPAELYKKLKEVTWERHNVIR